jgi:hypothetical protein
MDVSEVDRIEGAAEEGDFSRSGHGRKRLGAKSW